MTLDDDEECVKPIKTSPPKEIQTTIEDLRKDKPNEIVTNHRRMSLATIKDHFYLSFKG